MTLKINGEVIESREDIYKMFSDIVDEKDKDNFLDFTDTSDHHYENIAIAFYYVRNPEILQSELKEKFDVDPSVIRKILLPICFRFGYEYPVKNKKVVKVKYSYRGSDTLYETYKIIYKDHGPYLSGSREVEEVIEK